MKSETEHVAEFIKIKDAETEVLRAKLGDLIVENSKLKELLLKQEQSKHQSTESKGRRI